MKPSALAIVMCSVFCGCAGLRQQMATAGPTVFGTPSTAPATSGASGWSDTKLMIFGGSGHRIYLGCLNCSEYATDSVRNTYGPHGSSYADASVFNRYGDYGSAYSDWSSCNPY